MSVILGNPMALVGEKKPATPKFTYTGDYIKRDDGVVELRSSGVLTFNEAYVIDLFMVGGGGGGGNAQTNYNSQKASGGGGGGYTRTYRKLAVTNNASYNITVGAGGTVGVNGGASAFGANITVSGGNAGVNASGSGTKPTKGGDGGSGGGAGVINDSGYGAGGSDGANGENSNQSEYYGGTGQGFTTREFNEATGKLYSGGGGGGRYTSGLQPVISIGGAGGGGAGGWYHNTANNQPASAGDANTGGGGGGGAAVGAGSYTAGASGGSGIVCFRESVELPELVGTWKFNARIYPPENPFDISSKYVIDSRAPSAGSGYDRIYIVNNKLMGKATEGVAMSFYDFSTNTPGSVFGYFRTDSVQNFTDEFRAWLASNATKQ